MKVDINKYRRSAVPVLKRMVDRDRDNYSAEELISRAAVATGAHILAIATFYQEEYGGGDEVQAVVDKLKKFYKVEVV